MKKVLLLACMSCLMGCKPKPTIFLGFKLLSSEKDYYDHYSELVKEKKINGMYKTYCMECGTNYKTYDSRQVSFDIKPSFSEDQLNDLVLSGSIMGQTNEVKDSGSTYYLVDSDEVARTFQCILETYLNKYGKPTDTIGDKDNKYNISGINGADTGYRWQQNGYSVMLRFPETLFKKDYTHYNETYVLYNIVIQYLADWNTLDNKSGKEREQREKERPNDI